MKIVKHPHPALRFKSVPITRIDSKLRQVVAEMFELMYAANGIGLAANQVGLPLRFFIVNLQADPAAKDEEFVFINPVLKSKKGAEVGEEGCLSLPGLFADVRRPSNVTIEAYDLEGQGFEMRLDELPARVVQHETDHLDGIMFIDKLVSPISPENAARVTEFEEQFEASLFCGDAATLEDVNREIEAIAAAGAIP